MIIEQLKEGDIEDGRVFSRLMEHEHFWPALERLFQRLDHDIIDRFSSDEQVSRKWLKGARESLEAIPATIKQMSKDAETAEEERKQIDEAARSRGDDGLGSGDLALG